MEDTAHDNVESGDAHEWGVEKVATFVRALGPADCFMSECKHNNTDPCVNKTVV